AGVDPGRIRFRYGLDTRYLGQGNEITIWLGEGEQWPVTDAEVLAAFERDYKRVYGLTIPDVGIEAVTWRLSAYAPADVVEPHIVLAAGSGAPHRTRPVRFDRTAGAVDTPVYRREVLGAGQRVEGPCIVEERET